MKRLILLTLKQRKQVLIRSNKEQAAFLLRSDYTPLIDSQPDEGVSPYGSSNTL